MMRLPRSETAEPLQYLDAFMGVHNFHKLIVLDLADRSGFTGEITWDTSLPNGQPRRNLDASRATELFGFRATTSLRAGLERTIAWYRENALTRA